MRKLPVLILILSILFTTKQANAQKAGDVAAVAAGVIGGAMVVAATVEQYKEHLELRATEYLLENRPDFTDFELKILDYNATKLSDLSKVSCISFSIRFPDNIGQSKMVLLMFLSRGWMNEYGVDITRATFELFDSDKWSDLLYTYISIASPVKIDNKYNIPVYEKISSAKYASLNPNQTLKATNSEGDKFFMAKTKFISDIKRVSLSSSGMETKYLNKERVESAFLPFYRADNNDDLYKVADFSSKYKVVFNENSIGLYIKELQQLVQLRRSSINAIQSFLF